MKILFEWLLRMIWKTLFEWTMIWQIWIDLAVEKIVIPSGNLLHSY